MVACVVVAIIGAGQLGDSHVQQGDDGRNVVPARSGSRNGSVRDSIPSRSVVLLPQGEKVDVTPTSVPIPTPMPTAIPLPPPEAATDVGAIICSYSWDCGTAVAVACSESELWPLAANPSGARGVFQLMPVHAWRFAARGWNYWTDWDDPVRNTAIAYELWSEQGWTPWMSSWPWSCY